MDLNHFFSTVWKYLVWACQLLQNFARSAEIRQEARTSIELRTSCSTKFLVAITHFHMKPTKFPVAGRRSECISKAQDSGFRLAPTLVRFEWLLELVTISPFWEFITPHSHPSWASLILSHCRRWLRESEFVSWGNLTQGSRRVCDENGTRQHIFRHKKHANTTFHVSHDMGGVAFFRANTSLTITTISEHLRVRR